METAQQPWSSLENGGHSPFFLACAFYDGIFAPIAYARRLPTGLVYNSLTSSGHRSYPAMPSIDSIRHTYHLAAASPFRLLVSFDNDFCLRETYKCRLAAKLLHLVASGSFTSAFFSWNSRTEHRIRLCGSSGKLPDCEPFRSFGLPTAHVRLAQDQNCLFCFL